MRDQINEPATNSKNKNIRDLCREINEFNKGYQCRSNLVKDENCDLLEDSHDNLNWWENSSVSYSMCMVSVMLGGQKYIQLIC
jgi:hypothetical protein